MTNLKLDIISEISAKLIISLDIYANFYTGLEIPVLYTNNIKVVKQELVYVWNKVHTQ